MRVNKRKTSPVSGYAGVAVFAAEMNMFPPRVGSGNPPAPPGTASLPYQHERAHEASKARRGEPAKAQFAVEHCAGKPDPESGVFAAQGFLPFNPASTSFQSRARRQTPSLLCVSQRCFRTHGCHPRKGPAAPQGLAAPHALGAAEAFPARSPPCIPVR